MPVRATPEPPARAAVAFGAYRIPGDVDLLFRGGTVVALEPRAVRLLRHLAAHAGRVVPKRELLAEVWPHQFVTDDVLKQAVAKARRALGPAPGGGAWIETFHARGYRLADPGAPARGGAPAADAGDLAEAVAAIRRAADAVAALAASLAARTSRSSPRARSSRAGSPR